MDDSSFVLQGRSVRVYGSQIAFAVTHRRRVWRLAVAFPMQITDELIVFVGWLSLGRVKIVKGDWIVRNVRVFSIDLGQSVFSLRL